MSTGIIHHTLVGDEGKSGAKGPKNELKWRKCYEFEPNFDKNKLEFQR